MVDRILIKLCILSLSFLAAIGCSSAEKNETNDTAVEPDAYREIVVKAGDIDANFLELKEKVQLVLQDEKCGQKQRMIASVIGASAHYWDGDEENARKLAEAAFNCCPDHTIEFPRKWEADHWIETKTPQNVKKMVQMKDYILSCANYGYVDFKSANDIFVNDLEFAKSAELYRQALYRGIQDQDLRRTSYLRWAGSLYKQDNTKLAEKILLERWILDPKIEFALGDPSMIDYLRALIEKFHRDYRQFIEM